MITRSCNFLLKGFSNTVHYKTLCPKEFTYSRFFAVKSQLKGEHEESSELKVTSVKNQKKLIKLPFNDPGLSKIILKMKSKKMREKSNLIYFEGKRLLCDALKSGVTPLQVYFSQTKDISDIEFPEETQLVKIPYNDLKIWSDLTTCPGILTICRRPPVLEESDESMPVSVICDNVREPGNLGSFIRSSAGAGAQDIFLTKGCVDLWEPKVIRGGMGSHFRMPIYEDRNWENIHDSITKETLLVIAINEKVNSTMNNDIVPYYKINYSDYEHITLVIGGETEGISNDAVEFSKLRKSKIITIPLSNEVESLNCVSALSIILFEIKRQFQEKNHEIV